MLELSEVMKLEWIPSGWEAGGKRRTLVEVLFLNYVRSRHCIGVLCPRFVLLVFLCWDDELQIQQHQILVRIEGTRCHSFPHVWKNAPDQ